MSRALSLDLRTRVLKAVADGMSHRQAGERFGVSAASVNRWRRRAEVQGDARPKTLGGDRRSGRIEACKDLILGALAETPDLTIEELRRTLAGQGHTFGFGTIQRFFERHRITRKKDRACERAGSSRHREAPAGLVRRPARPRPRATGVHRRNVSLHQHGSAPRPGTAGRAPAGRHSARTLEDD